MRRQAWDGPIGLAALAAGFLLAGLGNPRAALADAHVLDGAGRVLTVGNWTTSSVDGGVLRTPDGRVLSWELRAADQLIMEGTVATTADSLVDGMPTLSRDPVSGDIWLAWSRQNDSGLRGIAVMKFVDNAWLPSSRLIVAAGTTSNQVDPFLVHDAGGRAYLAWRDMDWQRRVRLVVLASNETILDEQDLSADLSRPNGPPRLGIDPRGSVFAAFFGEDVATGASRLFVLSAPATAGGLLHVPNPVVELAGRTSMPTPDVLDTHRTTPTYPEVHLTVLSDVAVVWWTRTDDAGRSVFQHVEQTTGASWDGSQVGTIAVAGGSDDPTRQALEMLENRLRPAVVRQGSDPGDRSGRLGGDILRRR